MERKRQRCVIFDTTRAIRELVILSIEKLILVLAHLYRPSMCVCMCVFFEQTHCGTILLDETYAYFITFIVMRILPFIHI